jgi:hypothetical protein
MAGTHQGPAAKKPQTTDLTRQEKTMFLNPQISKQLADEHRRDLTTDARQQTLARQARAGSGPASHRQPLTNRLWRRLRPVTQPRLEPQA